MNDLMIYQLQRTQQLYCAMEMAWDFFSSPTNLSRITPEGIKFKMLSQLPDGHIFKGMVIDYTVSPMLGIPLNWRTEITQVNEHQSFTDTQRKGPYKLWHHLHEFIPNEHGVLMKDTVNYALPFSVVGRIAHKLFIRKKLDQIFDYRQRVCEVYFNKSTRG